jgi:hypothetical protein
MSDTASIAKAQREFWNGEATRRWVIEQARIDRLMSNVTEAALAAAAPKPGKASWMWGAGPARPFEDCRGCWAERSRAWR